MTNDIGPWDFLFTPNKWRVIAPFITASRWPIQIPSDTHPHHQGHRPAASRLPMSRKTKPRRINKSTRKALQDGEIVKNYRFIHWDEWFCLGKEIFLLEFLNPLLFCLEKIKPTFLWQKKKTINLLGGDFQPIWKIAGSFPKIGVN